MVTPETILYRWKKAIKDYWTYDKPKTRKKGRPPITKAMKLLIKKLKVENYLWGCKRIQDELEKISIDISRETIRKVIQDYRKAGEIKGVATTPYSPNLNAYAERFVRSVRQECLDWFIIFSEKQLRNILKSYMEYYNKYRPHQCINSIPEGRPPDVSGKIKKTPILYGLHHHYYRAS